MAHVLDTIRKAIRDSDRTPYAICKASGIARSQLSRLMTGKRGLSVEVLERLADQLGLELVIRPKQRK